MARSHGIKRPASYVPEWCRSELDKLSKADLMEIAYDLAMRAVGEDAGEIAAYDEVRQTALILVHHRGGKEPRIPRGAELFAEQTAPVTETTYLDHRIIKQGRVWEVRSLTGDYVGMYRTRRVAADVIEDRVQRAARRTATHQEG